LLSAKNPENGTVTYTYNSDHTLASKTDANGAQGGYSFIYTYDGYKRPLTVSVGGNLLRTYSYDTKTLNAGGVAGANLIYLNPQYWGSGYYEDRGTVLHELLHSVTGLTDTDFTRARYTGWRDALKNGGESFWGLSSTPPVRKPKPLPRRLR
jgi:YD repeat-containing protein